MRVEYVNLYNDDNDMVMIKFNCLAKPPKCILEEHGVMNHLALEIKKSAIFGFKQHGQDMKNVVNLKQMKNISGVDFQTRNSRHYFDVLNNKAVDIRTLPNGNLQIVVRGKQEETIPNA